MTFSASLVDIQVYFTLHILTCSSPRSARKFTFGCRRSAFRPRGHYTIRVLFTVPYSFYAYVFVSSTIMFAANDCFGCFMPCVRITHVASRYSNQTPGGAWTGKCRFGFELWSTYVLASLGCCMQGNITL
jgi:hypothetical protein